MIDVLRGFGVQMILGVDLAVYSNGEFSLVYSVEARARVSKLEVGFSTLERLMDMSPTLNAIIKTQGNGICS